MQHFTMNQFHKNAPPSASQDPTLPPELSHRRFQEDSSGRLYDARLRELLARETADDPSASVGALEALQALRVASKGTWLLLNRWADRHGLSEGRLHLMLCLKRREGRATPAGELAGALDVSPRNVTGLVDHLEADGLVRRIGDPADRRAVLVELTPAGKEKMGRIWREALDAQKDMTRDFTEAELADLRHLCLRLVSKIESMHPAPSSTAGGSEEEGR
ncbi:MAG: MarR family winged helix-turn-helix transcriptional regulator [Candidatus Dormibacterales bacterium]